MAKIGDLITSKTGTDASKATAEAAAAAASATLTAATVAAAASDATLARALVKIGPTVVLATPPVEYDSPDGVQIHVTPLNTVDVDVPDDAPPAPPVTDPNAPPAPAA